MNEVTPTRMVSLNVFQVGDHELRMLEHNGRLYSTPAATTAALERSEKAVYTVVQRHRDEFEFPLLSDIVTISNGVEANIVTNRDDVEYKLYTNSVQLEPSGELDFILRCLNLPQNKSNQHLLTLDDNITLGFFLRGSVAKQFRQYMREVAKRQILELNSERLFWKTKYQEQQTETNRLAEQAQYLNPIMGEIATAAGRGLALQRKTKPFRA